MTFAVLIQDTARLLPDNLAAFLNHPQLKFIYPCLDFDGTAVVNQLAEKVLSPRFGTGLLDPFLLRECHVSGGTPDSAVELDKESGEELKIIATAP